MSKEYKSLIQSMPLDLKQLFKEEYNIHLPKKPNLIAIKMQNSKRKRIIKDEYNLQSYENSLLAQQTSLPSLSNKPLSPLSAKINKFDYNSMFKSIDMQAHANSVRPSSNSARRPKLPYRGPNEPNIDAFDHEEPLQSKTINSVNLTLNMRPDPKYENPSNNKTPHRTSLPYENKVDQATDTRDRPSSQRSVNRTKLVRLFGTKSTSPIKLMNPEIYQTIDQFINDFGSREDGLFKLAKASSRTPSRKGSATGSYANFNGIPDSGGNTPSLTPRMKITHVRSASEITGLISSNVKTVKTPQVVVRKRRAISMSVAKSMPNPNPNPFILDARDEQLLFGYIPPNPNSEILHDVHRQPAVLNAEQSRQIWKKTLNRWDEEKVVVRKEKVPKFKTELFLSPFDAYKINNLLKMSLSPQERKKVFKLGKAPASKFPNRNTLKTPG